MRPDIPGMGTARPDGTPSSPTASLRSHLRHGDVVLSAGRRGTYQDEGIGNGLHWDDEIEGGNQ